MKKLVIVFALMLGVTSAFAQTEEELKAELASKKDSIAKLQGKADAIQAQIDALPGWKTGAFGTIGANISRALNNWYSNRKYQIRQQVILVLRLMVLPTCSRKNISGEIRLM